MVMEAGGPSDYGSPNNIHLTRIIDGEQRTETFNLKPTIHGHPTKPEYVQDGDVIYISRSFFDLRRGQGATCKHDFAMSNSPGPYRMR